MLLTGQDLRHNGYGATRRDRRAQSFLATEIVNAKLDMQSGQRFQVRANISSSLLRPALSASSGRPPTVSVKLLKPYCDKLISLPVDVLRMIVETSIRGPSRHSEVGCLADQHCKPRRYTRRKS